jgi:hypothetical protein
MSGGRIRPTQTGFTGDRAKDDAARDLDAVRRAANSRPFFDGFLIEGIANPETGAITTGVAFTAGQTRIIGHPLNRTARGVVVIGMPGVVSTPPVLSMAPDENTDLTREIRVTSAADGIGMLWVF